MNEEMNLQALFSEFLKIYKFLNHSKIIDALNIELNDNTKKTVYELSDGTRTTREIQKIAGVSISTITNYWKQWALKGIVIPAQRKGRYMAAFDLTEYGLSVLKVDEQGDDE
jgi:hypothetical protein